MTPRRVLIYTGVYSIELELNSSAEKVSLVQSKSSIRKLKSHMTANGNISHAYIIQRH